MKNEIVHKKDYYGFIEFQIKEKTEFHEGAIRLNCARQAINYLIKVNNYRKVFLPYYICDTVYKALEVDYEFYSLDENLLPKLDKKILKDDQAIIYPNYFGVNNSKAALVSSEYANVIIDNTQAFFQKIENADVVYSARKFFGVTDGAYAYSRKKADFKMEQDFSYHRMAPLFERIELEASAAYKQILKNEDDISASSMKKMSMLTQKLLSSIDYGGNLEIRQKNFRYLRSKLDAINEMKFEDSADLAPIAYPLLTKNNSLRQKLIENKIYIPTWWKTVQGNVDKDSIEYHMSEFLVPLPIDHRYDFNDLDYILTFIKF